MARVIGISCSLSLPVQELMSMEIKLAGVGFGTAKRDLFRAHIIKLCNSTGCGGYWKFIPIQRETGQNEWKKKSVGDY